jgi:hypothetical protein
MGLERSPSNAHGGEFTEFPKSAISRWYNFESSQAILSALTPGSSPLELNETRKGHPESVVLGRVPAEKLSEKTAPGGGNKHRPMSSWSQTGLLPQLSREPSGILP